MRSGLFFVGVRETILARNLLRQSHNRTLFPVCILVPQRTGEKISIDHTGVQYFNHDCDPTVNPSLHVQNGFLHFRCHELTKICEYNQGLLSNHSINRQNKRRNFSIDRGNSYHVCPYFLFLMSQERSNWLLIVGVTF